MRSGWACQRACPALAQHERVEVEAQRGDGRLQLVGDGRDEMPGDGGHDRAADRAQDFVAGVVAVGIVQLLEEVDVDEHQADGLAGAAGAQPFGIQRLVELAAVGHTRERVSGTESLQTLIGLFQRGRAFGRAVLPFAPGPMRRWLRPPISAE